MTPKCRHCGACCRADLCNAAIEVGFESAPCPALVPAGKLSLCALLVFERRHHEDQPRLHGLLGVGVGCGAVTLRRKTRRLEREMEERKCI
jgi:hypothetical protein